MQRKEVMLHYTKTGKGQQTATIPWISSDFTSFTSPASYNLGQPWYDDFGNVFILRKAQTAFTIGQVASQAAPLTATVQAGSTTRIVNTNATLVASAEKGNFFTDSTIGDAGTNAADVLKLIKDNSGGANATLTVSLLDTKNSNLQPDADAYVVAPANADLGLIVRPNNVIPFPVANITFDVPVGIAVQAIAIGTFGFLQTRGLALVKAKGDVTPWVTGKPVVPDGVTAGFAKGAATVQITATGANIGQAMQASAAAAAASALGAVMLTLEPYS